jgi:predicted transcriptional regulator
MGYIYVIEELVKLGIKKKEIAKFLRVESKTISKWISEKSRPSKNQRDYIERIDVETIKSALSGRTPGHHILEYTDLKN